MLKEAAMVVELAGAVEEVVDAGLKVPMLGLAMMVAIRKRPEERDGEATAPKSVEEARMEDIDTSLLLSEGGQVGGCIQWPRVFPLIVSTQMVLYNHETSRSHATCACTRSRDQRSHSHRAIFGVSAEHSGGGKRDVEVACIH